MTRLLFLATCVASVLSSVSAAVGTGDGTSAVSNGGAPSSDEQCSGPDCGGAMPGGMPPASGGNSKPSDFSVNPSAMPPPAMMGSKESGCMLMKMSMGASAPMQEVAKPAMAMGKMWNVEVGGPAGLVYTPPTINAAVGDMITFKFLAKNHTLTQSTFPKPCVKASNPPGLDTGFMPNPDGKSPPPMVVYQVMTSKPQWFYCRQKGHCGMGMAFSINPTADKSQDKFVSMAKAQNGTAMLAPPPPSGGSTSTTTTTSVTIMTTTSMTMTMSSMTTASVTAISQISDGQIQAPPAGGSPPPASAPAAAAAPPPPPPPPASPPAAASPPPPAAAPPAAAPAMPAGFNSGMMAPGSGSGSGGETCSCTCMCGVSAFPAADQGMGMYGGMSGAVPAAGGAMAPAGGGYRFKG